MSARMTIRSSQHLGQLIAAARRARKLTQRDVARELGVTQSWVSHVESGNQKAWVGQILRLATWLGIEITGTLSDISSKKRSRRDVSQHPDIDEIVR
jgi:transcriptional regulator with XRE-family HTH domain